MTEIANLGDIWNWLPTFRAVAETEHLPTASKRLHVTPAAISRTIGLLEDRLGYSLFNRGGKRLVLNGRGRTLLASVTDAMSSVESGLFALDEDPMAGPIRVSSLGVLTNHYVLPPLLELSAEHPDLRPELRVLGTAEAAEQLLRGSIDVAFVYESMTLDAVHIERLGASPNSVYCGSGHPLFERKHVGLEDALEHPFSVPQIGDTGQILDSWPADIERTIGMRITLLTTNLEVCKSGRFLTVLPDVTAHPFVASGALRRLDFDIIDAAPIYAARRADGGQGRARGVVDAVAARVQAVEARLKEVGEGR